MIIRGKEWIEVAAKLKETSDKITFLEGKKKELSKLLQELSEFKDSCGGGYEYKSSERVGTINYKIIPELQGIDLNPYRGVNLNIWRLTFKKQFEDII